MLERGTRKKSPEMQKINLLVIVGLLIMASCHPASMPPIAPILTPTPIVLQVRPLHFDHPFVVLSPGKLQEEIAQWQFLADPSDELSVDELTAPAKNLAELTRTQAEEDVRYLFRLFKHGYAGYGAFNQNGRFDRAQANILKALSNQPTLSRDKLAILIQSHLSFVYDCHLNLGGYGLFQHLNYYYWDGFNFFKDGERFWTWGTGGENWLESVNGQPPGEYLKLSLTSEGDPVYRLGSIAPSQPEDFSLDLVHGDGTRDQRTGSWLTSPFNSDRTAFSHYTEQGIPIVVNRTLLGDDASLQRFQADTASLRNESLFILDLRGNNGGLSGWAEGWVRNLTGFVPRWPFTATELDTRTVFAGKINLAGMINLDTGSVTTARLRESYRTAMNDIDRGARRRGWTSLEIPLFSIIPNPRQLVVVLTDGRIASSGEGFLGYLRQLQNVVFVGENSGGCGIFGDVTTYTLPHSGIAIQLSSKLFLPTDLTNTEGKGYMPDLWVPAGNALPYAIVAIKRGWLKSPQ